MSDSMTAPAKLQAKDGSHLDANAPSASRVSSVHPEIQEERLDDKVSPVGDEPGILKPGGSGDGKRVEKAPVGVKSRKF